MAMSRREVLRRWMIANDLTYRDFAERLGLSVPGVFHLLNRDVIPKERHEALLALGVPMRLLPAAREQKKRAVFPCDKPGWKGPASHAIPEEKVAP